MAARQTSSLDPAYLRAAIAASWWGTHGTPIPDDALLYWYGKASQVETYSDQVDRIGWNAYWEARMSPGNDGSADPALGDQPARFPPLPVPPVPGPPESSDLADRVEALEATVARLLRQLRAV